MVSLRNATPFVYEVNLYHDQYCALGAECGCKEEMWEQSAVEPDGIAGLRRGDRRVPATARIPVGGALTFHDAVLGLSGIERAISRGELLRETVAEPEARRSRARSSS
jgi:hypothetical protein